jgi:hypothetical protein
MADPRLILSIRFWHPTLIAKDIIDNIEIKPYIVQSIGEKFVLMNGKVTNKTNKETYVVYDFIKTEDNDISTSITCANNCLLKSIYFINKFKKTGGRLNYYITVISGEKYDFILTPTIIKTCERIGVEISVEIFADEKIFTDSVFTHRGIHI